MDKFIIVFCFCVNIALLHMKLIDMNTFWIVWVFIIVKMLITASIRENNQ